jgi:AbrB family looped-hinge helix DNA binding protein
MSTVVNIDQKGRVIIPKSFREKANIKAAPGKLLIVPKETGCIELVQVEDDLKIAKQIASKKLKEWKEEEHKGEKLLLEMFK